MKNMRPGWIDSRYKDYSWGQLKDAQNVWDLAKAQERQNELLEEQNRLLYGNNYNTNYRYSSSSEDINVLGLLSTLSIIPISLGFIMTFLTMGDGTEQGIKILLAGLVCPVLQGSIYLIKSISKSNHERKIAREKEEARKARIERRLNKN